MSAAPSLLPLSVDAMIVRGAALVAALAISTLGVALSIPVFFNSDPTGFEAGLGEDFLDEDTDVTFDSNTGSAGAVTFGAAIAPECCGTPFVVTIAVSFRLEFAFPETATGFSGSVSTILGFLMTSDADASFGRMVGSGGGRGADAVPCRSLYKASNSVSCFVSCEHAASRHISRSDA